MEYTTLGRTALEVSRLCLGTMNFGPHTPAPEAHTILDRALELRLEPAVLERLDTIWPGPGGEAPEAYAW